MAISKVFKEKLSAKCKDFGLTSKALDELSELGVRTLSDEATDDDINNAVDSLVPFAKAMQGEITRKTRKQSSTEKQSNDEGKGDEGKDKGENVPDWFKTQLQSINDRLQKMQDENDALKAEKAKTDRQNTIASKAKELGIPSYLVKRLAIADDADIDKELSDFKQDLVNEKLLPKEATQETGNTEEAMKADAKAWAASLPNL